MLPGIIFFGDISKPHVKGTVSGNYLFLLQEYRQQLQNTYFSGRRMNDQFLSVESLNEIQCSAIKYLLSPVGLPSLYFLIYHVISLMSIVWHGRK